MTFSIASPSADEIAAAPRAFSLYRQSLGADDTVDAKVRQLRHRWVSPTCLWSCMSKAFDVEVQSLALKAREGACSACRQPSLVPARFASVLMLRPVY